MGLSAYLLGIQTAAQMSRDPLRGNLFENLVVIDALKYQYNRGERSSLHYYRDSRGHEVDLLVDAAGRLCPIEIKSGATVVKEFFSSIEKFSVMLCVKACSGGVVYGGVDSYPFKNHSVTSYSLVHRLMASICEGTAS